MLPPLIEGSRTRGGKRSSKNNMEKPRVTDRTSRTEIISNRCRQQNEKGQTRLNQFAEVGKDATA